MAEKEGKTFTSSVFLRFALWPSFIALLRYDMLRTFKVTPWCGVSVHDVLPWASDAVKLFSSAYLYSLENNL